MGWGGGGRYQRGGVGWGGGRYQRGGVGWGGGEIPAGWGGVGEIPAINCSLN